MPKPEKDGETPVVQGEKPEAVPVEGATETPSHDPDWMTKLSEQQLTDLETKYEGLTSGLKSALNKEREAHKSAAKLSNLSEDDLESIRRFDGGVEQMQRIAVLFGVPEGEASALTSPAAIEGYALGRKAAIAGQATENVSDFRKALADPVREPVGAGTGANAAPIVRAQTKEEIMDAYIADPNEENTKAYRGMRGI